MTDQGNILAVVVSKESFVWEDPQTRDPKRILSQALPGCVVGIQDKEKNRVRVRMPDKYEGWIDAPRIREMTREELTEWRGHGMVLVTRREGLAFTKRANPEPIFVLPYGSALPMVEDLEDLEDRVLVRLPDGSQGTIRKEETVPGDALGWVGKDRGTIQMILNDAEELKTVAYTWGGTSSLTGFDCSGFVQTVFRVRGYSLPRDAQQQWSLGEAVPPTKIRPGDLLFFKDPAVTDRDVTHVSIALGPDGFVDVGSYWPVGLSKRSPYYSKTRASQFIGARRVF